MTSPSPPNTGSSDPRPRYVEVVVDIPADKTFTYAVPKALQAEAAVGRRVLVSLGNRRAFGFIVGASPDTTIENPREILALPDPEPLFDAKDLSFYRWVASYYLYPLGRTLAEILPPPATEKTKTTIGLQCPGEEGACLQSGAGSLACPRAARRRSRRQEAVIAFLREHGPTPPELVRSSLGETPAVLAALRKRGCLGHCRQAVFRKPPPGRRLGAAGETPVLNEWQAQAVSAVRERLAEGGFAPLLLHGVTGSGKTEVYLRAVETVLAEGGGVLCLVPEIALTPQFLSRFRDRFPGEAFAVLHSGIAGACRHDQWRQIRQGAIRVVIGARSALFAPVRRLRLMIVDEEHDPSYKQDDRLRYHARDLAVVKAKHEGALVLLGSATPALQTTFNTTARHYGHLVLPERVLDRPLPAVSVVDLRKTTEAGGGPAPILSPPLQTAMDEVLGQGGQILLFLNRRGFHPFVVCLACGRALRCRNCAIALTFHAGGDLLKCHSCGFAVPAAMPCSSCGSDRIQRYGVGTERVEAEARRCFPGARVARMDSDTTAQRGAHEHILTALDRREIDILVGTQMITKGHDFPHIALVGVICADTALNLPDYASAERTFQLLTQAAGRPGRADTPGRVIIQTFHPDHHALVHARAHDYDGFYREELAARQELGYPPFGRLINLHLSSLRLAEGRAAVAALGRRAVDLCRTPAWRGRLEVLGPAEAPIARLRNRWRWHLLLKGRDSASLHGFARQLLRVAADSPLRIGVDVDPVHFL